MVTWIDLNAPYYPSYARAYPRQRRSQPARAAEMARLRALTGIDLDGSGTWETNRGALVSFDRPELSPCLAGLDAGAGRRPWPSFATASTRRGCGPAARSPKLRPPPPSTGVARRLFVSVSSSTSAAVPPSAPARRSTTPERPPRGLSPGWRTGARVAGIRVIGTWHSVIGTRPFTFCLLPSPGAPDNLLSGWRSHKRSGRVPPTALDPPDTDLLSLRNRDKPSGPRSLQPFRPLPSALCPLPSALCPLPSALRPPPSALCPLPSALRPLPSALCPLPSVQYNIPGDQQCLEVTRLARMPDPPGRAGSTGHGTQTTAPCHADGDAARGSSAGLRQPRSNQGGSDQPESSHDHEPRGVGGSRSREIASSRTPTGHGSENARWKTPQPCPSRASGRPVDLRGPTRRASRRAGPAP